MPAPIAQQLYPWLVNYLPHITQTFGVNGETGVDLGTPYGTPITSLTYGTLKNKGYYGGGGVVSVEAVIDGKKTTPYYQHLDLINKDLVIGQALKPGDLLGWSGGQLQGGNHPATCCSSGPHIEVGRDAPYGGIWGKQYQKNANPVPWLLRLVNGDTSAMGQPTSPNILDYSNGTLQTMFTPLVNPLNADSTIADFAKALDEACAVSNPFQGDLNFNPVDGSPAFGEIGAALWGDVTAISLRAMLIFFGVLMAGAVILSVIPIHQTIEEAQQTVPALV